MSTYLSVNHRNIPDNLRATRWWVCWKAIPTQGADKPRKVPFGRHRKPGAHNKPSEWLDFNDAIRLYETGEYTGIGICVPRPIEGEAGLIAIDLDHVFARDAEGKRVITASAPKQLIHLALAAGVYAELSPSDTGLHLLVLGTLPSDATTRGIEVYAGYASRFVTITGHRIRRGDVVQAQPVAQAFWDAARAARKGATPCCPTTDRGSSLEGWWDRLEDSSKDAELRRMLDAFPQSVWDNGEQPWLTIIAACARSGAPHAEEIAREFSKRGACFSEAEFMSRFGSFR